MASKADLKAAKDAEKALEKAAKDAEKALEKAAKELAKAEKDAAKAAERLAAKEAKEELKEAKQAAKAADKALKEEAKEERMAANAAARAEKEEARMEKAERLERERQEAHEESVRIGREQRAADVQARVLDEINGKIRSFIARDEPLSREDIDGRWLEGIGQLSCQKLRAQGRLELQPDGITVSLLPPSAGAPPPDSYTDQLGLTVARIEAAVAHHEANPPVSVVPTGAVRIRTARGGGVFLSVEHFDTLSCTPFESSAEVFQLKPRVDGEDPSDNHYRRLKSRQGRYVTLSAGGSGATLENFSGDALEFHTAGYFNGTPRYIIGSARGGAAWLKVEGRSVEVVKSRTQGTEFEVVLA